MIKRFVFAAIAMVAFGAGITLAHAQSIGVTLPSVPTGVNATVVPPSQISVSWGGSTESSGTIAGYYVYRNGAQFATTAGTSLVDANLLPGDYTYTVSAYDTNGNVSALSSPSASVALISDTTPPSVPANVTITGVTSTNSSYASTTLTISWTASTDNVGVAGYQVYRDGIMITSSTSPFTGTSITDTVFPGFYIYTVRAYDASQNFSNQSPAANVVVSVDNAPPSTPTAITVQQVSGSGVNIMWATSTDPIGVAGYQVFRNGIQIASAGGPPYADSGLSAGSEYAYAITAYDAVGNISGKSSPVAITLQQANGPSVPYIVSGTVSGTSTVKIVWGPSGDALPITGYTIYRDNTQIATAAGTSTSYLDLGLASGTYVYNISATDLSGAVSATSSAMTVMVSGTVTATAIPAIVSLPSSSLSASAPTATPEMVPGIVFTQSLYFGLRNAQVESLQSLLAQNGYLAPAYATGFFGNLTLAALEKFQCAQDIVCTGGPGWGLVGPKTRAVLNALEGGQGGQTIGATSASLSTPASSPANLNAELQALEVELANLEQQAKP